MNEEKTKKFLTFFLALLAIAIPLISYLVNSSKKESNEVLIVTDYNDFYTVSSCISRFNDYLNNSDSESLLLMISNQYKKDKKITKENVLNVEFTRLADSEFEPKKMYYQIQNKNVTKFYVYGFLVVDGFDRVEEKKSVYYVVYIDSNNGVFSIEPYDGSIFMDGGSNG